MNDFVFNCEARKPTTHSGPHKMNFRFPWRGSHSGRVSQPAHVLVLKACDTGFRPKTQLGPRERPHHAERLVASGSASAILLGALSRPNRCYGLNDYIFGLCIISSIFNYYTV